MTRSTHLGLSSGKKRPYVLPLNNPSVVKVGEATHLRPDDLVVGVLVAGQARAYPWWILSNHHVVNDVLVLSADPVGYLLPNDRGVDGKPMSPWYETVPLLVTLCEACAGCAAYLPVFDDEPDHPLVFTFAERSTHGYSALGIFTISDIETQSRWHPLTGRAHSGSLAGRRLKRLPAFTERWDRWSREFPDSDVVFAAEEMRHRYHVRHLPRVEDDAAHTNTWVTRNRRPELIDHRFGRNELVIGVGALDSDKAVAASLRQLRDAGGLLQCDIDGAPCLLVVGGEYRAFAYSRRVAGQVLDFEVASRDPLRLRDSAGTVWSFFGEGLSGPQAGGRLELMPDSYVSKWSDWSLAHPGAAIAEPVPA